MLAITTLERIRNAFAHGRLLTTSEIPARLWNFNGAKKGRVVIEFSEELTVEWMKKTALIPEGDAPHGYSVSQKSMSSS